MFIESPTRYVTPHAGHAARQPLRLPLRYAHRVPLHPGRYGRGLHRHSMRSTTRAVFAPVALTSTYPRAPQRPRHAASDYALAACHALCGDGAPPKLATLEGRPPRTAGFAVAAAKLRPTVAVMGSSNVVGQVTAAAGQRQAARTLLPTVLTPALSGSRRNK